MLLEMRNSFMSGECPVFSFTIALKSGNTALRNPSGSMCILSQKSMDRKLYIQKNREASNWNQGNGISSQGFSFPNSISEVLVNNNDSNKTG